MATQRPSVDVITGVIKANLPTRISFQVTSKIDSRTILGEQGAEQLLGKGDMLYMPGGKQIARVHGPFVSDEEVRAVAEHWKAQGRPEYIQAVTEEPEDGGYMFEGQPTGEDDPEAQLYRKAVQTVAESQKASTSYLQRQLRVGYNNAARLIERMEKDGVVSAPDHVGRREVLVDPCPDPACLGARLEAARIRHHHARLRQGPVGAGGADAAGLGDARFPEQPDDGQALQPALQRRRRGQRLPLDRPPPERRTAGLTFCHSSGRKLPSPRKALAIAVGVAGISPCCPARRLPRSSLA
jgi:hypothetical protein